MRSNDIKVEEESSDALQGFQSNFIYEEELSDLHAGQFCRNKDRQTLETVNNVGMLIQIFISGYSKILFVLSFLPPFFYQSRFSLSKSVWTLMTW